MPDNPIFQAGFPATPPPGFRPRTEQRGGIDTQVITIDVNGGGGSESLISAANPMPVTVLSGTMLIQPGADPLPAAAATGVMFDGVTPVTPKFAPIAASTSGDNEVVAAVVGKRIRVLKYTIVAAGAVAAKFATAAGGATDLTGPMPMPANGGVGGAYCPIGLFETEAAEALVLNLSAGVAVAGHLTYIEVD